MKNIFICQSSWYSCEFLLVSSFLDHRVACMWNLEKVSLLRRTGVEGVLKTLRRERAFRRASRGTHNLFFQARVRQERALETAKCMVASTHKQKTGKDRKNKGRKSKHEILLVLAPRCRCCVCADQGFHNQAVISCPISSAKEPPGGSCKAS